MNSEYSIKEQYVFFSKMKINDFIEENDYKSAFTSLVALLNRVDDEKQNAIIKYYDDCMFEKYVSDRY